MGEFVVEVEAGLVEFSCSVQWAEGAGVSFLGGHGDEEYWRRDVVRVTVSNNLDCSELLILLRDWLDW